MSSSTPVPEFHPTPPGAAPEIAEAIRAHAAAAARADAALDDLDALPDSAAFRTAGQRQADEAGDAELGALDRLGDAMRGHLATRADVDAAVGHADRQAERGREPGAQEAVLRRLIGALRDRLPE